VLTVSMGHWNVSTGYDNIIFRPIAPIMHITEEFT